MATTAQIIIDRAVQRGALNNPDLVPSAQLLQYISMYERAVYLRAGRVNPDYFGTDGSTATRALFTDAWDLAATPGNVAVVTRIEVVTIVGSVSGVVAGDKINLISRRWPEVDLAPRAFVRGRKVTGFGVELGANSSNMVTVLKVFFSPLPAVVTTLSQSLTIPDEWTGLVELPLAKTLALRDRRLDEIPAIDAEYQFIFQLFEEGALAFDHSVRRPLASVPAIPLTGGK